MSFTTIEIESPVPGCKAWQMGECTVFAGKEPMGWHMSISHPKRYPHWEEIKHSRYAFLPDNITMAMLLPPKNEYVNLHNNCFHLHEIEAN